MRKNPKTLSQKVTYWLGVVAIGLLAGLSLQFVLAWTEPSAAPPSTNVGAPINTGGMLQWKSGPFYVYNQMLAYSLGLYGSGSVLQVPSGTVDTQDVWLRNANSGAGAWASTLGATAAAPIAPTYFYNRSNGTGNYVDTQLDCLAGDTAVSGSCVGYDGCSDSDTTSFGGYPVGNGWFCPRQSCTRVATYVRCYSTKVPIPVFCSNGYLSGDSVITSSGPCSATVPDVCGGNGCWSGQATGSFSGTRTVSGQTCDSNGNLVPFTQTQACSTGTVTYCSNSLYCNFW